MIRKIIVSIGIILITAAVAFSVVPHFIQKKNAEEARTIVERMRKLMAEPYDTAVDDRTNTTMSVIELEGVDFVGIIEIPIYGCTLPVCGRWNADDTVKYPCRFTGSIYDGTLVIGGTEVVGQFDFMKLITEDDSVYVTDTLGGRYKLHVSAIEITDDVTAENLCDPDADLTIFAKKSGKTEYTIVRCVYK